MPSPDMPASAKAHPLEQTYENIFGLLPTRDLQTKQLDFFKKSYLESSNPLQGHKP